MTAEKRALIIGFLGPAIQGVGLLWLTLHMLAVHWHGAFTLRHIAFEPGVLLVGVGFAVGVVLLPVALDVARARPEDLEVPLFGVDSRSAVQGELWPSAQTSGNH